MLKELNFDENLINEKQKISELSGGERIKFILLCELMKEPTCLLLDEPSNDLDINSIEWLKNFIKNIDIPIIFISHDEDLIENCANVIIHIEQLIRKQKPKISIEKLDYENYVENRGNAIERQERIAKKQREEFDKKQRKYQKIYERVQHEIRSTKNDFWGTELKIKMHTVKSIGRKLEKEKENLLDFPDYEESIFVKFDENVNYSTKKEILDLNLEKLVIGSKILSENLELKVFGTDKICIIGENGVGKTTLLKIILKNVKKNVKIAYMPQNYDDKMNVDMSIIDYLSKTYEKEEMVPYIDRAIAGENVYSQDIIDTTWGPIFTACYPVSANLDGTGEIIGAFCIEMDMQSAYGMVEKTNHISIICGLVAGAILLLICLYTYYVYQKSKAEEQKQKQLLMTAAEEADAANKAKSAFLLSISHDIRTPMNAIIGFTNIALHQNTVSDIHYSLEKVQKSSNHLLSLLNDVLDFTRIESGKVTISPEPMDITQLTDNVQAIMNGLLYNRDLKFEVHREISKNPYVLADVVRIREVLVNLLGNAVKFTKDGGKITLDIRSYPGADEKHIITRYVVQDNGIGMSEEFQKKLFDPFSQEDDANARTQYKGTGLGMAITKKYVDMMGGSIAVESKKGVGSTFTVEIPLELTEQVIQSEQKQHLHRDLTGIHVLMAEDNDLNVELATIMLEDAGMTVTLASDGKEVVNLFKNHPRGTYDFILMDIMMPNMDGHQAAKAIRALGIERSDAVTIPIVALSANAFIDDIQESLDSGMKDHISKPINMEELIDTITKYIKHD